MDTQTLVERYWQLANARDWAGYGALLSPEVVYDMPQTRERLTGREHYLEFNRTYPGQWRAELLQVIAQEDRAVSVVAMHLNGSVETGITFFEFTNGLITRLTDHWPAPYVPPPRMTAAIEFY
jgi:hypothetical protein